MRAPGHGTVLATRETLAIMRLRMGDGRGRSLEPVAYGETPRHRRRRSVPCAGGPHSRQRAGGAGTWRQARRRLRRLQAPAPIRPARRSSRCPATSSSPRRPSACPSSAIPTMPARSTGCCIRWRSFPSAAIWSASMRWASASACWRCCGARGYERTGLSPRRAAPRWSRSMRAWAWRWGRCCAVTGVAREEFARQNRAGAAVGRRRAVGAAPARSGGGDGLGLDARAPARQAARRRAAAGDLRSRRLGRAAAHHRRHRAQRRSG